MRLEGRKHVDSNIQEVNLTAFQKIRLAWVSHPPYGTLGSVLLQHYRMLIIHVAKSVEAYLVSSGGFIMLMLF